MFYILSWKYKVNVTSHRRIKIGILEFNFVTYFRRPMQSLF